MGIISTIEKNEKKSDVRRCFGLSPSTTDAIWIGKKKTSAKILKSATKEEDEQKEDEEEQYDDLKRQSI